MSTDELVELVDYGALAPLASEAQIHSFSATCIVQLRTISKLRLDFDLDVFTAGLLLGYLDRIDDLERQLRSLRATASHRFDTSTGMPARSVFPSGKE